jgi:nucleotide-binding universal stress UspA family protein
MIRMEHILVATDFGDASETALRYGRELARAFGAKLHVLHVVEPPMMLAGPDAIAINTAQLASDMEDAARRQLANLVAPEDRRELDLVTALRTGRAPAFEIAAYAKEAGVNLIIIGTHGRGLMGHLLMGIVAEKVVRIAHCPVLTVRSPEHEFVLPDALQALTTARP